MRVKIVVDIGRRVREEHKQRGLSQEFLAQPVSRIQEHSGKGLDAM